MTANPGGGDYTPDDTYPRDGCEGPPIRITPASVAQGAPDATETPDGTGTGDDAAQGRTEAQGDVYDEIRTERERAHAKHGDKSMESWHPTDYARLAILMEEVGEVAREFNESEIAERDMDLPALRAELIQVAAMAAAWADACPSERGQS